MNTISFLNSNDLDAAWQIEQASHSFPWSQKVFFSNQGHHYLNLKSQSNGQITGFAITQVIADEATLFNIAVAPQFQRQGIGRSLLEALISELSQRQVTHLWLEVRESNQGAIMLYDSFGFNEIMRRSGYYPAKKGREDAIIMVLQID